ncbi:Proteophosphoglycan 5, related [Eimeria brunetti]|uniref:Proteophosphoglycan 5, related n=1 Tax=Eimeria brunetti TaxID=51314 RepID=U6LI62_9EIME|nr:Proteophosphoglycan 5, related [Eimeria brunetti]
MDGCEGNPIDAKPAAAVAAASERQKLSAPSGDFWETAYRACNVGSCGLSAPTALERAPTAVRSASADPPSSGGSKFQDRPYPRECSVAIHMSCCPQRSVGGYSFDHSTLSDEGFADASSVVSGNRPPESFKRIEREVQTAGSGAELQEADSRCICISRQCPKVCCEQRAKVRCLSSPGSLAVPSPALAQLTHCSQDEANASPFRRSGRPNNPTPPVSSKEANDRVPVCQSPSVAKEPYCNVTLNPNSFTEGSPKHIQEESSLGEASGCLKPTTCNFSQEEKVLPSGPALPQNCLPSKKYEEMEKEHQPAQHKPILKTSNIGAEISILRKGGSPQSPNVHIRNTARSAFECEGAAALPKGTCFQGEASTGVKDLEKLREQREWKSIQESQTYCGEKLHPIQGATENTHATGAIVEEFMGAKGRSPRSPLQRPDEGTLGCSPLCPSSPGCAFSSFFTSSELLHLLHEDTCSPKSAAVVMADHAPYPSNPLELEAHTGTESSSAVPVGSGNCGKMKPIDLDKQSPTPAASSRFQPPPAFSLSQAQSPQPCHTSLSCLHTVECVVPGSSKTRTRSPRIHKCFYPTKETKSPLQSCSPQAPTAPNTTFNNSHALAEAAVMDEVKVACPSSPPSTAISYPVTQLRVAENPTFPLVIRASDDASMAMKNERVQQTETNRPFVRDWKGAATSDPKELNKRQAALPQNSKLARTTAEGNPSHLRGSTSPQESRDQQGYEADSGLLSPLKRGTESREELNYDAVEADPSAAFLYAPEGPSGSKSTECTPAGRSLASRFLSHLRQGMRLSRRRSRSISTSRNSCNSPVHKKGTGSGEAECEGRNVIVTVPGPCVRPPEKVAGPTKTLFAPAEPPEFISFTFDTRVDIGGGHAAALPKKTASPLLLNAAESEKIPAGAQRHAVQTTAVSEVSQAHDTAKDMLQLNGPVFSVSASHSCFPPSDACSNSQSEDPVSLSAQFTEKAGDKRIPKKWANSQKAESLSCFSQQKWGVETTLKKSANSNGMIEDSKDWRRSIPTGTIDDYCNFREQPKFNFQDIHLTSCLGPPRQTASPLDFTTESEESSGGSQLHLSGGLSRKEELQKWQHLLELNSILQKRHHR